MLTPKQKGNISEIEAILSLMKEGYNISIPYGDSMPYDFILDVNGTLIKVQNKASSIKDGYIVFSTRHMNRKYQPGTVDFFSTTCNGITYMIPSKFCSSGKRLRIDSPKNNQTKGINYASDYTLDKLESLIKEQIN